MAQHRGLVMLLAAVLLATTLGANAYPLIWTGIASDCAAVPQGSYGPHDSPVEDRDTVLTVHRLGSAVVKACPGLTHKITAKFPEERQYIITATQGSVAGVKDKCLNRAISSISQPAAEVELNLPCDAAGSLRLNLVSVASPGPKTYKQTSMTLPINPLSACPASPCNAKAADMSNLLLESAPVATADGAAMAAAGPTVGPATAAPGGGATVVIANPAAEAALPAVPVAAPAAPAPINLWSLLKLPGAGAGENARASPQAQLIHLLQSLNGGGQANGEGGSMASVMQQLGNVNATAVMQVLRTVAKMMPEPGEPAPKFDMASVMEFVQAVGAVVPGGASAPAPDIPSATLNVLKSLGKLVPGQSEGGDFIAVLNFLRASGDLVGKVVALRAPSA